MISPFNKEIRLTLPKAQAEWLENTCKKAKISKSKYISWCLAKKAEELLKVLNLNSYLGNYKKEEIAEIIEEPKITDDEIFEILDEFEARKQSIKKS